MEIRNPANSHKSLIDSDMGILQQIRPRERIA
jgi:hypothetical protein